MKIRWIRVLCTMAAVFLTVATLSDADVGVRYTRNREYHPTGDAVFSSGMADLWGGVVLQAEARFVDSQGVAIDPTRLNLGPFDGTKNELCIEFKAQCFLYTIDKDTLTRLFSWIENGGTGLYTAYENIDPDVVHDAALSPSTFGGYISSEFSASRVEDVAYYLDFPEDTNVPDRLDEIIALRNKRVSTPWDFDSLVDRNWVVSDLDSNFVISLRDGRAFARGTIYQYDRGEIPSTGEIVVTMVNELAERATDASDNSQLHNKAVAFAQSAALLRSFHRHNKETWKGLAFKIFN